MYICSIVYFQDRAARLFQCFSENQMKGNTDKCHLLMTKDIKEDKSSEIHIGKSTINSSDCEKLLGIIKLFQNFIFEDQVLDLYKKPKNYEH